MACHYCINCGRCRGEAGNAIFVRHCVLCGHENAAGSRECAACGGSLKLTPGITNLSDVVSGHSNKGKGGTDGTA